MGGRGRRLAGLAGADDLARSGSTVASAGLSDTLTANEPSGTWPPASWALALPSRPAAMRQENAVGAGGDRVTFHVKVLSGRGAARRGPTCSCRRSCRPSGRRRRSTPAGWGRRGPGGPRACERVDGHRDRGDRARVGVADLDDELLALRHVLGGREARCRRRRRCRCPTSRRRPGGPRRRSRRPPARRGQHGCAPLLTARGKATIRGARARRFVAALCEGGMKPTFPFGVRARGHIRFCAEGSEHPRFEERSWYVASPIERSCRRRTCSRKSGT